MSQLGEKWAKCLSQNDEQSLALRVNVLTFRHLLLYFKTRARQRRLWSKIEAKFISFYIPVKFMRGVGKMSE